MLILPLLALGCVPVPVDPTGRPFDAVEAQQGLNTGTRAEAPPTSPDFGAMSLTLPTIPAPPTATDLARADRTDPDLPDRLGAASAGEAAVPSMRSPPPRGINPTAIELSWDPAMPTRDEAFGVRLIGTMIDAEPPNAVLRLPGGSKALVEAGEMLDDDGLLVLAVGDRVVKLVKVTKQGWYAKVETAVLHSNPSGDPPRRPAAQVDPAAAPAVATPAPAVP